ncbi:LamB/YcsF family protein [Alicyclobacillus tolerans]|uniref:LamB/YcsF family protein n=1 Tax=Alicyclobacillus tolerans TaxID=90970 RepID=UPI003B82C393
MLTIDLNCDFAEGFGPYRIGAGREMLQYVSSVNLACGFHAGDPAIMRQMVYEARDAGVAVGAHPGLPDKLGFGRRRMDISKDEAYEMVVYQIGALQAFCTVAGIRLHHVKPHGALYNMAAVQADLAQAIAQAVKDVSPDAVLYGLSGSELVRAGREIGLHTASEVFADRTYQADGSLTPRNVKGALLENGEQAVQQVLQMIRTGTVCTLNGENIPIIGETVCLHGDGNHALHFAQTIHRRLLEEGISIQAACGNANE